ncbi:MAG: hypothetical protein GY810_09545 [Aureispira sp.]|nr:hypothetical protein [Aureispira sp.]
MKQELTELIKLSQQYLKISKANGLELNSQTQEIAKLNKVVKKIYVNKFSKTTKKREQGGQSNEEEFIKHYDKADFYFNFLVQGFNIEFSGDNIESIFITQNGINTPISNYKYNLTYNSDNAPLEGVKIKLYKEISNLFDYSAKDITITLNATDLESDQIISETKSIKIPSYASSYEIEISCTWLAQKFPKTNDAIVNSFGSLRRDIFDLKTILDTHKGKLETDVRNIGSAYSTAYTTHKNAIADNEAAKAATDQLISSIFTIAGAGFLSWLSSTDQLKTILGGISKSLNTETIENVTEDLLQVTLDKTMPSAASLSTGQAAAAKLGLTLPLNFQNDLTNKLSNIFNDISESIASFSKSCGDKMDNLEYNMNDGGEVDLHKQYMVLQSAHELYTTIKKQVDNICKVRYNIPSDLAEQIEKQIWAGWARENIKMKTVVKAQIIPIPWEYPVDSPYIGWPLVLRWQALKIDSDLGITFGSAEWWGDEIEEMMNWGNSYQPKVLF